MLFFGLRLKSALFTLFILFLPFLLLAEGELSTYDLDSPRDLSDQGYAKSVYFNKMAYNVTRYSDGTWLPGRKGDYIGCMRYDTDSSGKIIKPKRMKWVAASSKTGDDNLSGQDVTACVYNGRIYVFYDFINPAKWEERFIYYKSSIDPETRGFEPNGGIKIEAIPAIDTGFGPSAPKLNVTAAVLNEKLYVFYTHINWDQIASVVFDGKKWSAGPTLQNLRLRSLDSQTVLTNTGKQVIAIVGTNGKYMSVIGFDGIQYHPSFESVDFEEAGLNQDYLRVAYGSVKGGAQSNLLQIFAAGGNDLIRYEYLLSGDLGHDGQFSSPATAIAGKKPRGWGVVTSFRNDANNNLQQYSSLVFEYINRDVQSAAGTYVSDYYKFLESNQIDTSKPETLPGAWTILGVIEGVPPFSLNGTTPIRSTSAVNYGESASKEISTAQIYEASFSIGIGGKNDSIGGGIEFTQGFKNVYDWSKTIETKFNITMENMAGNKLGDKGYLIVSKPTLEVRNYERYPSDKSTKLNDLNFTYVTDVSIESVPYLLETPYPGMAVRPKSSDYEKWYGNTVPKESIIQKMNAMTADTSGGISSATSISVTSTDTITGESKSTVKVELSFLSIFKASSAFSFTLRNATSTRLSKHISASLMLPEAPSGYTGKKLTRIVVFPYWLAPPENSNQKSFWIPDDYQWNKPWCLTWSVANMNPPVYSSKALTIDFNRDGIQDVISRETPAAALKVSAKSGYPQYGTAYIISREEQEAMKDEDLFVPDGAQLLCSADFDSDGSCDLLWYHPSEHWLAAQVIDFDGEKVLREITGVKMDESNRPIEAGDFQKMDSIAEILVRDSATGSLLLYSLDENLNVGRVDTIFSPDNPSVEYVGKGDFDGNDCYDVLVRDPDNGACKIIFLQEPDEKDNIVMRVAEIDPDMQAGKAIVSARDLTLLGICDFNGDMKSDIIYRDERGRLFVALMDGEIVAKSGYIAAPKIGEKQSLVTIGDFNGDFCADLLFLRRSGKRNNLMIRYVGPPKNPAKSKKPVVSKGNDSLGIGDEFRDSQDTTIFPSLD